MESASQFDYADPSPPPAANVRRHQSLNYPNAAGPKRMTALKRAGTLQTTPIKTHQSQGYSSGQSPSPTGAEEDGHEQEEESHFPVVQGNYPPTFGRSSPWGTPGASGNNDWRTPTRSITPGSNQNTAMDEVQRALSTIELNQAHQPPVTYQPSPPPRFSLNHPPNQQNLRRGSQSGASTPAMTNNQGNGGRKLNLVTDVNDGRGGQGLPQGTGGPTSASAYTMPALAHGLSQRENPEFRGQGGNQRERALTASSAGQWEQKERVIVGRSSNPNLSGSYRNGGGNGVNHDIPNVPPIPPQFLSNQGQAPRLGQNQNNFVVLGGGQLGQNQSAGVNSNANPSATQFPIRSENLITSPVDIPTLLATKGYNPVDFDIKPPCVSVCGLPEKSH
jgi:hypothetical protein